MATHKSIPYRLSSHLSVDGNHRASRAYTFSNHGWIGIYLYVTEVGTRQETIGKIKVGMRVVTLEGGAPSKISILMRTIVKLLPWEIAHTFIWQMQYVFYQSGYEADVPIWIFAGLSVSMILVIIYVAMIALRQDGRAPHDLVAGTRVDLR